MRQGPDQCVRCLELVAKDRLDRFKVCVCQGRLIGLSLAAQARAFRTGWGHGFCTGSASMITWASAHG